MKTLKQMYESRGDSYYPTDKNTTHSYLDIYDTLFLPFKDKKINILEVGVGPGGSLRLWSEYFQNAKIYGYDISPTVNYNRLDKNVTCIIKDINKMMEDEFENIPLSIAIDDASHILTEQILFIKLIYPHIIPGGILIVEDISDIDNQQQIFKSIGVPFEVIDLRNVKGRYDDVLLLFKKHDYLRT